MPDVIATILNLPSDNGDPIERVDYRVDGGSAVNSGLTSPFTGAFTITDGSDKNIQVRPVNSVDNDPDNWSDVKTVSAAPSEFSVEESGLEPVITTGDGNISVTIASGTYAGTYTQRHDGAPLTVAMIEAASTCLVLPVVTGTTNVGDTLTIVPGFWLYEGADPGDQTWVQNLDAVPTGETDLDYVIQAGDVGKDFTVEETFDGTTVSSAAVTVG